VSGATRHSVVFRRRCHRCRPRAPRAARRFKACASPCRLTRPPARPGRIFPPGLGLTWMRGLIVTVVSPPSVHLEPLNAAPALDARQRRYALADSRLQFLAEHMGTVCRARAQLQRPRPGFAAVWRSGAWWWPAKHGSTRRAFQRAPLCSSRAAAGVNDTVTVQNSGQRLEQVDASARWRPGDPHHVVPSMSLIS
jgi:hypothetical protein